MKKIYTKLISSMGGAQYRRESDGAYIPESEGNRDYQEMLELVDAGTAEIVTEAHPA